jgi:hypothetical protein
MFTKKKLPNESSGPTSARVGVSTSIPFDEMAAKLAADQAAKLAAQQEADYTILPRNSKAVINTALLTGTGVNTGLMPSLPLPSTVGLSYDPKPILNARSFSDHLTNPPAVSNYAIAPPPKGASRVRQPVDLMKFDGGRGSSYKSKKGGKKGVRRSASRKRCRRKGKRSRKAHS